MSNFRIVLDAGHGAGKAHNRGGVCYNEGDNNYYYSLVLKKELEKLDGVKVDLVRTKITDDPSLSARSRMGNGYDLFLSLHSNAFNGKARGTVILDNVARPNKSLADKLVKEIAGLFGHSNRGVTYKKNNSGDNWYGVLRGNKAKSSMIIEHGFHDNSIDCNFFKNNHLQIAQATTNVIANHYNLKGSNTSTDKGGNVGRLTYYNRTKNNKGDGVVQLQKDLEKLGYSVGKYGTNGIFGQDTEKAVEDFQRTFGLEVDGSAGPATLAKIKNLLEIKKQSNELYKVQVGAYSQKDNANRKLEELKDKGIDGYIKKE